MFLTAIEQYNPDQPQTHLEDGGLSSTHVSQLQFRHEEGPALVPGKPMVITRSEASRIAWCKVIAYQPPSHAHMAQTLAISNELKQMPHDQLVALARSAKGSLKASGENAAAIVRRLRDEWEDRD